MLRIIALNDDNVGNTEDDLERVTKEAEVSSCFLLNFFVFLLYASLCG